MIHTIVKRSAAMLAVTATMFAAAAWGTSAMRTAHAATATPEITINAPSDEANAVNGHSFVAIQLAGYDTANMAQEANGDYDGVNLTPVSNDVNAAIYAAARQADTIANIPSDNAMSWVAKNFSDSTSSSDAVNLRNFVTHLVANSDFAGFVKAAQSAGQTATGSNASAVFTNLPSEGVYVIVDTTANDAQADSTYTASIPMLVGTKINGSNLKNQTLGVINVKNQALALTKTQESPATPYVTIGQNVDWQLASTVPDTQGYDTYRYVFKDTMSAGLSYAGNLVVKVGSGDSAKTLSPTTDYTVAGPTTQSDGSSLFSVDLTSSIKSFAAGEPITVSYRTTVNSKANVTYDDLKNAATLNYANAHTVEVTKHVYVLGFTLHKIDKTTSEGIAGAQFSITRNTETTPLSFSHDASNSSVYSYRASDAASVDTLTTNNDGNITVGGLAPGTYTVKETKAAEGYESMVLPSFTVTISANDDGSEHMVFTQDAWGLSSFDSANNVVSVRNVTALTQLPMTGGAGLIIFAIVAAIMALVAGIVLIRARKSSSQE